MEFCCQKKLLLLLLILKLAAFLVGGWPPVWEERVSFAHHISRRPPIQYLAGYQQVKMPPLEEAGQ